MSQDHDDEKIAQDRWPEDLYDELAPQVAFLEGAAHGRKAEREKLAEEIKELKQKHAEEIRVRNEATKVWIQSDTQARAYCNQLEKQLGGNAGDKD